MDYHSVINQSEKEYPFVISFFPWIIINSDNGTIYICRLLELRFGFFWLVTYIHSERVLQLQMQLTTEV